MVDLLTSSIEMEAQRNGVLDANNLTVLHAGLPVRHGVDDSQRLSIEQGIDRLHHFRIRDAAILLDNECRDDTPLNTSLLGFCRILYIVVKELHESFGATRILWHLLHHVEGIVSGRLLGGSLHLAFHRDDVVLLYDLDFLAIHLDGASLLAFLHGLLLLRFVVNIVCDGSGIQGQGETHDGDEGQQFQQTAAL